MKRFGLVIVLYTLLAVAATHPLWQHLADSVPGDVGDPVLNSYILAWDAHALVTAPANLFDANFFFPLRDTLAFSENLGGTALLALPLMLLSGEPVLTYNLMFLASFVLAGAGMYLLMLHITRPPPHEPMIARGRRGTVSRPPHNDPLAGGRARETVRPVQWTRSSRRLAAFAAGVAFAFAPYHIASLSHLQLLTIGWLPLLILALSHSLDGSSGAQTRSDELVGMSPDSPSLSMPPAAGGVKPSPASRLQSLAPAAGAPRQWLPGVLAAVFLWMQVAASLHAALFAALCVLVFALAHARQLAARGRGLRLEFIAPVAVAVCLLLPLGLPYAAVLDTLRAARPPDIAQSFSAQPSDFFAAEPGNRWFGALTAALRTRPGFSEEQMLFMGIVAPLLAVLGLAAGMTRYQTRRRWALFFAALALLAVLLASSASVAQVLPLAGVMRVPARWAAVLTFALAGLGGMGVAWIEERAHALRAGGVRGAAIIVGASLVALLYLEGFTAPIALADVGTLRAQHAIYYALARLPGQEAVLELPMYTGTKRESAESKRMLASAVHWRPLVNGYSGITPPQTVALAAELAGFPDDASLAALRALGRQGVRYVIVHAGEPGIPRRDWNQTNRARALASGVLRLVQTIDDNDLLEIVGD